MAGVNKVILIDEYNKGSSLTELARRHGISVSTARHHVLKAGVLRSRSDGVRLAARAGNLGGGWRGKKREFTNEHCKAIAAAMVKRGEENAAGVSVKPSGYREFTRGKNKGRAEHVVKMEQRLGRSLLPDEVVHHIDGDRLNNDDSNLALMTRSGHARLHRIQESMSGTFRERDSNGRFS